MSYRNALKRLSQYLLRFLITRVGLVDHALFMRLYIPFLKSQGANIIGRPRYISPRARLDWTDLSLITIGHDAVISSDVRIITHDFSVARVEAGRRARVGEAPDPAVEELNKTGPVIVGENSFVGAFSLLLPGVRIGRDCIIGAGSVVRGKVPDGTITTGNPARVVGQIYE